MPALAAQATMRSCRCMSGRFVTQRRFFLPRKNRLVRDTYRRDEEVRRADRRWRACLGAGDQIVPRCGRRGLDRAGLQGFDAALPPAPTLEEVPAWRDGRR